MAAPHIPICLSSWPLGRTRTVTSAQFSKTKRFLRRERAPPQRSLAVVVAVDHPTKFGVPVEALFKIDQEEDHG